MPFPKLPPGAAYLVLSNPARRNALSFEVLAQLRSQLTQYNTSKSGELLQLPPFNAKHTSALPQWLRDSRAWQEQRGHLPKALVLRSEGPVFSSGHDLKKMHAPDFGQEDIVRRTFELCAEVMQLIQRCPIPVVCPIQGLATAAGFQLAMSTDYPIALADTAFQLPGMTIGLPCTSPSTTVSRRVPPAVAYRMFMTGELMRADQLQGAVDVVPVPEHAESTDTRTIAFEKRVHGVIERLVSLPGQPQAYGKWAFWTQLTLDTDSVFQWTGQRMVSHNESGEAKEGITAFLEKRKPKWQT